MPVDKTKILLKYVRSTNKSYSAPNKWLSTAMKCSRIARAKVQKSYISLKINFDVEINLYKNTEIII